MAHLGVAIWPVLGAGAPAEFSAGRPPAVGLGHLQPLISSLILTHLLRISFAFSLRPWRTPRSPSPVLVLGCSRLPTNSAARASCPGRPRSPAVRSLPSTGCLHLPPVLLCPMQHGGIAVPKNPAVVVVSPAWPWQPRPPVAASRAAHGSNSGAVVWLSDDRAGSSKNHCQM